MRVILGVLGIILTAAVIIMPTTLYGDKQERAYISDAFKWFADRDPKAPLPEKFELKFLPDGKRGLTATLTRKPGKEGCPSKYGCYSLTYDPATRALACSNRDCTEDLLP